MTRFFLLLWLLLSSTFSFSQGFKNDSVKSFIDKTIELIAFNSIHTENLEAIKRDLYHKSLNLNSIDETAPLYEDVFKQLHDYHGGLLPDVEVLEGDNLEDLRKDRKIIKALELFGK